MILIEAYEDHKAMFWVGIFVIIGVSLGVPMLLMTEAQPQAQLVFVSGTEYMFNEPAQIIVRLLDYQHKPMDAVCTGTVLYPNKTIYYTSPMSLQSPFHNYYMTFTTPSVVGVYEEMAHCTYNNATSEINNTQTFHISNSTNVVRRDISLGTNLTIKTINNQTTYINTSFETIYDLLDAINQTELNNEILEYLQINVTDLQQQILNVATDTNTDLEGLDDQLEYQIGYNETNQSVKSLLLQIWQNLTYTSPEIITLTIEAPSTTIRGFSWYILARLSNQNNATKTGSQYECYSETSLLGNLTMPYNPSTQKFENYTTATITGLNTYTVKCNEV